MVRHFLKLAMATAFVAVPMQANAVTNNIPFNGTVTHTCTITLTNAGGTLAADTANFQSLSSTNAGGQAGTADIVATGNTFQISIDAPSTFDSEPVADASAETFSASYSTSGANTLTGSATGGNNSGGSTLSMGTTNVSVDLAASKSGSDVFEAGSYSATVVLRCE